MNQFKYFAQFEPGKKRGVVVVSFPDVPEAITQGDDEADAVAQAEEALGLALLTYPARDMPLPRPKRHAGLVPIAVQPDVAAKLAVIEAVRAAGITKTEFARRIGKDEKEARRILDPRHATKLPTLAAALRELGQQLVVAVEPIREHELLPA
jgi:antitoxin HicB